MSNKINWDDGSFEFVKEETLMKMKTKKYFGSNVPLTSCEFCLEKDCAKYQATASDISERIFSKYFYEEMEDKNTVLNVIEELSCNLQNDFGLTDAKLFICVVLQLLKKVDEETLVDITDKFKQQVLKLIIK